MEWLNLNVLPDYYEVETRQAPQVRWHDLVERIFKEFLSHTPISAIGINHHVHFRAENSDASDRVGRKLVPLKPWGIL